MSGCVSSYPFPRIRFRLTDFFLYSIFASTKDHRPAPSPTFIQFVQFVFHFICVHIFSHRIVCRRAAVDAVLFKNMRTDAHLFDAVYWIYNCRIAPSICRNSIVYHLNGACTRCAAINAETDFFLARLKVIRRWCECANDFATFSIVRREDNEKCSTANWWNNFWFIVIGQNTSIDVSVRVCACCAIDADIFNGFHHFPSCASHPNRWINSRLLFTRVHIRVSFISFSVCVNLRA